MTVIINLYIVIFVSELNFFYTNRTRWCTLKELLAFFTGSETIPPQGFGKRCRVSSIDDPVQRLPTASTCGLEIRLPTCHDDYGTFREAMILAIKDSKGFGQF
jgi:hypothetical protein